MRVRSLFSLSLLFPALLLSAGAAKAQIAPPGTARAAGPARAALAGDYGRLPLQFEVNRGQAPKPVQFLSRGKGYSLFLTPTEAVLAMRKGASPSHAAKPGDSVVRMKLIGANGSPQMAARAPLLGHVNYLIGSDRRQWRRNVPTFGQAAYHGVYPGIDLLYYGNQGRLEYDFVVAPGADPAHIRLAFHGTTGARVDGQGNLSLPMTGAPALLWHRPVAYQTVAGKRRLVASRYVVDAGRTVGFRLGRYDTTRPLVIDPTLVYSTFLDSPTVSGTGDGGAQGLAVDAAGCAYVVGNTVSADFPTSATAFQKTNKGLNTTAFRTPAVTVPNAFVSKLSADGKTLLYSTYLGGTGGPGAYGGYGGDTAHAVAVDGAGSAYVTGTTISGDFPVTPGAFQKTGNLYFTDTAGNKYWNNTTYAFLSKLTADGSNLIYSTYFGNASVNGTSGSAVVVDGQGNAYVGGFEQGSPFPVTANALYTSFQKAAAFGAGGAGFVTKFNATGSGLLYSTLIPAPATALAIDAAGDAYVVGATEKTDYPATANAFQATPNGTYQDACVMELNPTGTGLVYSTLIGGKNNDAATGIAVDASGMIYVAGWSYGQDFPTTPGAYDRIGSKAAGYNYWIAKFDPNAATGPASLVFSTFFGPSLAEYYDNAAPKLALAKNGSIVLSGSTTTWTPNFANLFASLYGYGSTLIPPTPDALQPTFGGGATTYSSIEPLDLFLMVMDPTGSKVTYCTYFGGTGDDKLQSMAQGPDGDIYLGGSTKSPDFPITPSDVFQSAFKGVLGNEDDGRASGFVARFHILQQSELPIITGGLPPSGGIYGPGDGVTPRQVTRHITGTGHAGCQIQITVKDTAHPNSGDNFVLPLITVGTDGTWAADLTLFDCAPEVDIVQICPGETPSNPVVWTGPVDGTAPVFVNGTGPADGTDYITGGGGTATITLDGTGSDTGSFVPGDAVSYEWRLISGGANGTAYTVIGGATGAILNYPAGPGDYYFDVVLTDTAGNKRVHRCHRHVHAPLTVVSGLADGSLQGPGDSPDAGHVKWHVTGTGDPGCTVTLSFTDLIHPAVVPAPLTTTVGADGTWSLDPDLANCSYDVTVTQVCPDGSETIKRHVYVDGTAPVFVNGGPGDGTDIIGTGGTAQIVLDGTATDESYTPGNGVSYQWYLESGGTPVKIDGATGPGLTLAEPLGDYYIDLTVTDKFGNKRTKRCHHTVVKRSTSISLVCPATGIPYGSTFDPGATVIDKLTNTPVPGAVITYTIGGQPFTAGSELLLAPGSYTLAAHYGGDAIYFACDGTCDLTVLDTPGKITGGGSLDQSVRNFGFVVQTKSRGGALSFTGDVQFQDKAKGYNLHSTAITHIAVASDNIHGAFEGTATLNGVAGYSFTCYVEDNGEPGGGVDRFRILISGPSGFAAYDSSLVATKGGLLDQSGNIQIHKAQ